MIHYVDLIFSVVLLALGGVIAACNWTAPLRSWRSRRSDSILPLVGPVFLAAGVYFLTGSGWWALIGIPLDLLGALAFAASLPWIFRELWYTSSFARLHRFKCRDRGRDIAIELFRNSRASFTVVFNKSEAPKYFGSCPVQISFSAQWNEVDDGFEIFEYADGRRLKLSRSDGKFAAAELLVPKHAALTTLMDGLRFAEWRR